MTAERKRREAGSTRMRILMWSAALLLAACAEMSDPANNSAEAASSSNASAPLVEVVAPDPTPLPSPTPTPVVVPPSDSDGDSSATEGGDGSPIMLAALQPEDTRGLEGELGCDFVRRSGDMIFVGLGYVADAGRAQGVYRVGNTAEKVLMGRPGGYNAMSAGGKFGGRGMTLTIERGAQIPLESEQTSHTATLRAQRGDGAERTYDGSWTCGP